MNIDEIIIDEWNTNHIARHKVKPVEIEEIFNNRIALFPAKKGRKMVIGKTNQDRIISVILDLKNKNKYYLITARDSNKKEKEIYKNYEKNTKL